MTNIQVEHLTKRFGRLAAVDDLSFAVQEGRVTGFLGANGSGKTTTLRVLLGLSEATAGTATIGGRRYAELPNPIREVGAVIANDTFHPGRSAAEHLLVLATAAGIDATANRRRPRSGRSRRRGRPQGRWLLARHAPTAEPRSRVTRRAQACWYSTSR